MTRRLVIETLPCPECSYPNRTTYEYDLLKFEGVCLKCGKKVTFTTDRPLRILTRRI